MSEIPKNTASRIARNLLLSGAELRILAGFRSSWPHTYVPNLGQPNLSPAHHSRPAASPHQPTSAQPTPTQPSPTRPDPDHTPPSSSSHLLYARPAWGLPPRGGCRNHRARTLEPTLLGESCRGGALWREGGSSSQHPRILLRQRNATLGCIDPTYDRARWRFDDAAPRKSQGPCVGASTQRGLFPLLNHPGGVPSAVPSIADPCKFVKAEGSSLNELH